MTKQFYKFIRNREFNEFAIVELLEPIKSPGPIRVRDTKTNKELWAMRDMIEMFNPRNTNEQDRSVTGIE